MSKLNFKLTKSESEYLKSVKETMFELECEESGIFGDEDKKKYYHSFNSLMDWEKNLLILYSKYKSYYKVAQRLNVQKTATIHVIKEIRNKLNYIINDKDTTICEHCDSSDLGHIQSPTRDSEQNSRNNHKG